MTWDSLLHFGECLLQLFSLNDYKSLKKKKGYLGNDK